MGKFFTVDVLPDCIAGDISDNDGAADIAAGDIIFGWTAVDVPKGSCMLRSITATVNAEDGAYGSGSLTDLELLFAKSIDGVAPPSIGTIGVVPSCNGTTNWARHLVGAYRLEQGAGGGTFAKTPFRVVYSSGLNGGGDSNLGISTVIDLEPESGTNVGYDKLYIAGIQVNARNYGTATLVNGAITSDTATSITVDGTDVRKVFCIGDTVYIQAVDTALGTIKSMTHDGTDGTIVLNAAISGGTDLTDDHELLNANPWRFKLGFER